MAQNWRPPTWLILVLAFLFGRGCFASANVDSLRSRVRHLESKVEKLEAR